MYKYIKYYNFMKSLEVFIKENNLNKSYEYDPKKDYIPFRDFIAFGKISNGVRPAQIKTVKDVKNTVKAITTPSGVKLKNSIIEKLVKENPNIGILKYTKIDNEYEWKVKVNIDNVDYVFTIVFDKYGFDIGYLGHLETCIGNYHKYTYIY